MDLQSLYSTLYLSICSTTCGHSILHGLGYILQVKYCQMLSRGALCKRVCNLDSRCTYIWAPSSSTWSYFSLDWASSLFYPLLSIWALFPNSLSFRFCVQFWFWSVDHLAAILYRIPHTCLLRLFLTSDVFINPWWPVHVVVSMDLKNETCSF